MAASENGHTKAVELLLDSGANANKMDVYEKTALLWATENGHVDIIKLLEINEAGAAPSSSPN